MKKNFLDLNVWVLLDNRPGNDNQSIAVADALGIKYQKKKIIYNSLIKLPNGLLSKRRLSFVNKIDSAKIKGPWPDIVIGAGRRLSLVSRYIKNKNKSTVVVQLMWPGTFAKEFDLIAVPKHDRPKKKKNIILTNGSPNLINPKTLKENEKYWGKRLPYFEKKKIALLVGGSSPGHKFDLKYAKDLALKVRKISEKYDAAILASTSRRTGKKITEVLRNVLPESTCFFEWSEEKRKNPFIGFLAISDLIVVTGDSISMCSEACSAGKQVYIYAPKETVSNKHRRFHKALYKDKLARPFIGKIINFNRPEKKIGSAAEIVASKISDIIEAKLT